MWYSIFHHNKEKDMRAVRLLFFSVFILPLSGCIADGFVMPGVSVSDVIEKVSFDKDCPKEQVTILKKITAPGTGSYKVEACGQQYDYEHTGTVVFEKGKGPLG
jgi:hypothetical protein